MIDPFRLLLIKVTPAIQRHANMEWQCIEHFNDDGTANYNDGTNGTFNPSFPSACPYVTSVGATQIPAGGSPTQSENACQSVTISGGGFSNNFSLPDYQSDALQDWFQNYNPGYPEGTYNDS
jgi:tripeptidyl-peptidase-1